MRIEDWQSQLKIGDMKKRPQDIVVLLKIIALKHYDWYNSDLAQLLKISPSEISEILQTVTNGLEELKDDMVFIGGVVAEFYANDLAASDIRPTLDVDCVIELSSR